MAYIKEVRDKSCAENVEKKEFSYSIGKNVNYHLLPMENSVKISQKLKIELLTNISTPGCLNNTVNPNDSVHVSIYCNAIYSNQDLEKSQVPSTDE